MAENEPAAGAPEQILRDRLPHEDNAYEPGPPKKPTVKEERVIEREGFGDDCC